MYSRGLERGGGGMPVDDGGAGGTGNAVVVGLAQAANGRDAGLGEEVHGQVAQALLGDDQVRLVLGNLSALPLYVLFLQLQQRGPATAKYCHVTICHPL